MELGEYDQSMPMGLAGTKQEAALAADWTFQEQELLEDALVRYADEPNIMKYIKVATLLPDKTVRDVALRCQWMMKKESGKRQKVEEYVSAKSDIGKDKRLDHKLQASIPSKEHAHATLYSFLEPLMDFKFLDEAAVIDGATNHLLNENIGILCQIEANLETLKLGDNIHLLNRARNNINTMLNSLGQMPPLPGMADQMPPLQVSLHEMLADGVLPAAHLSQQQIPYSTVGVRWLN